MTIEERLYNYGFNKPPEHKQQILTEYNNFCVNCLEQKKANKWPFQMLMSGAKTVMEFWLSDGPTWPLLQELALQVFTMAASTAASERYFSTFRLVHSKLCNRLNDASVKKLVYIKINVKELDEDYDDSYNSFSD